VEKGGSVHAVGLGVWCRRAWVARERGEAAVSGWVGCGVGAGWVAVSGLGDGGWGRAVVNCVRG